MFPGFNSFPHRPNQVPANPSSQKVVASNPSTASASNILPNGVPIQPQLGVLPQNMVALNSLLTQLSNAPNHLLALQSNQLAMQQLMGIGSQNNTQTLNAVPGQFFNMGQSSNALNLFQPLSQNMFLPNLQYSIPNAMQNVNQHLSMQISNPPQLPYHNGPPFPNPIMGPDGIRQQINQSQQKLVSSAIGANGIGRLAVTGQQLQENNAVTVNPHLHQAKGNSYGRGGGSNSNSNFRNFPRKEFTRNPRKEGFQKSHFHHMQNGKRKFDYADGCGGKETRNEKTQKSGPHQLTNQANERKRLSITYTEQEIKQWREERRKNHPSSSNAKKKQMDSNISETDAKTRREQLKEILAKQAELGVEVAEIPSHYFSGLENKFPRAEGNRTFTRNDRFQNRYDKRRKHNRRERFSRNNRSGDAASPRAPPSLRKSEPTLLKKLLSRDIRRDKLRLLQVFRFMVMNSFFKDGPQEPLKFPSVIIAENGSEGSVFEEKCSVITEADLGDCSKRIPAENYEGTLGGNEDSVRDDNTGDEDDVHENVDNGLCVHEEDEEEGEITD